MTDSGSLCASREPSVWFVVCNADLRDLLSRAQAGEDADLLLIEFYANTDRDEEAE